MSAALATWIDGQRTDVLPSDDRGLHYGDGLFETLAVRAGRARFLEAHLARLAHGCARLGIRFDANAELRAELAEASALVPQAMLKIIVTRGSAVRRGYAPHGSETARRMLSAWPAAALPAAIAAGVDLHVATLKVGDNSALAGIKHLSRLENVLATAEASKAGAFDALLLDTAGQVISGAMSNVFIVRGGRVLTPSVDRSGVAGVMRAMVLRECPALAIDAMESRISLEDLFAADEVFITNVRIGVVPVRRVGEHSVRMHTFAQRLGTHIEALDA